MENLQDYVGLSKHKTKIVEMLMTLQEGENRLKIIEIMGNGDDWFLNQKVKAAKNIERQIACEMMAIDPERALTSIKAWKQSIKLTAGRKRSVAFTGLEDYLRYRVDDLGEL